MPIELPLTFPLPLSFPFFLSQVSGPLLHLPAGPFNHLIPLLPQFGAIQWDKEDIAAGAGVPTAAVEDLVKPKVMRDTGVVHNYYNHQESAAPS